MHDMTMAQSVGEEPIRDHRREWTPEELDEWFGGDRYEMGEQIRADRAAALAELQEENNELRARIAELTAPVQWAVIVKGERGRVWYRTDSSSSPDKEFIVDRMREFREQYPLMRFDMVDVKDGHDIAPIKYRPWAQ
jgi:hypothetical protein